MNYRESLNQGLTQLMDKDERVFVIGEDVLDPYGGAFKVTKGLSSQFPGRVLTTPISEASITGFGTGMALQGFKPIVEIMFGDFLTLAADQIINTMAKFCLMFKEKEIPVIIRTPMGGGRGYGPTHSQSLEKIYLGIPGLKVFSPSVFHHPGQLLASISEKEKQPSLFIEHKLLYGDEILDASSDELIIENYSCAGEYPIKSVKNYQEPNPDVVVIAYGGMSRIIRDVMVDYKDEEIRIQALFPSLISSLPKEFFQSVPKICGKVIIVEEGTESFNWGSEISSSLYEYGHDNMKLSIKRIAAQDAVIPAARDLENEVLPSYQAIAQAIEDMCL